MIWKSKVGRGKSMGCINANNNNNNKSRKMFTIKSHRIKLKLFGLCECASVALSIRLECCSSRGNRLSFYPFDSSALAERLINTVESSRKEMYSTENWPNSFECKKRIDIWAYCKWYLLRFWMRDALNIEWFLIFSCVRWIGFPIRVCVCVFLNNCNNFSIVKKSEWKQKWKWERNSKGKSTHWMNFYCPMNRRWISIGIERCG